MPYLTLTENLKLQLSPGLVASYDIQPGNRVGLFWDKHTYVYLLTYFPRTHTGDGITGVNIMSSIANINRHWTCGAECIIESVTIT